MTTPTIEGLRHKALRHSEQAMAPDEHRWQVGPKNKRHQRRRNLRRVEYAMAKKTRLVADLVDRRTRP